MKRGKYAMMSKGSDVTVQAMNAYMPSSTLVLVASY